MRPFVQLRDRLGWKDCRFSMTPQRGFTGKSTFNIEHYYLTLTLLVNKAEAKAKAKEIDIHLPPPPSRQTPRAWHDGSQSPTDRIRYSPQAGKSVSHVSHTSHLFTGVGSKRQAEARCLSLGARFSQFSHFRLTSSLTYSAGRNA
jgi:hypothetical protein